MTRSLNAPGAPVAPAPDDPAWSALNLLRTPVWVFDIDHRRVFWANTAALQVWNASSLEALCARDMGQDMSASVAKRLAQYQADFCRHDARFREQWTLYPGGRPVSLHVHYRGYRLPDGRMAMWCEGEPVGTDSPESLRSVEALLHTPMMIGLYSLDGRPLWRNPAARASVRDANETLAQRFADDQAYLQLHAALAEHGELTLTMAVQTAEGPRWHEVSARRRLDAVTGEAAVLVSEVDVTPLKQSEAQALYLSEHDVLTGLPNRGLAQQHFARMVQQVRRHAGPGGLQAALVIIDLDRFKDVNDSWGHAAGDALLVQVAERLRSAVRSGDLVARFGGDEFLILLCAPEVREEIAHIHPRLREALARPYLLNGHRTQVSATVGVSVFPDHGEDFETLLQHADLAMYQGKAAGRDALAFYQHGLSEQVRARTTLAEELRQALAARAFHLFYQPRWGSEPGQILGAEALLRWQHPERGWVLPGEFLPLLESLGLMRELGRQVFDMAARQQAAWVEAGHRLRLSINLSPSEFNDGHLLSDLQTVLARTGCPPQALELEITESMLIGDDAHTLATLQSLRDLGVSIALDDFGTGYSNLAYLQRFPFDTVKLDRRFVQAAEPDRVLTAAIIGLCHALGLKPVAEGVESRCQHDWLCSQGVQEFQGFLYAPALPAPDFERLLRGAPAAPAHGHSPGT